MLITKMTWYRARRGEKRKTPLSRRIKAEHEKVHIDRGYANLEIVFFFRKRNSFSLKGHSSNQAA
jgi:hypothetical protein